MSIWMNPWGSGDRKVGTPDATSMSSVSASAQPQGIEFKVMVVGVEWTVQRTATTWEFQTKGARVDGRASPMRGDITTSEIALALNNGPRSAKNVPPEIPDAVLRRIISALNEQNR